jgi:hypothetical protein
MPDFVKQPNKDKKDRPKPILEMGDSPKPGNKDKPLDTFKQLLTEFKSGIRSLKSQNDSKSVSTVNNHTYSATNTNTQYNTNKSLNDKSRNDFQSIITPTSGRQHPILTPTSIKPPKATTEAPIEGKRAPSTISIDEKNNRTAPSGSRITGNQDNPRIKPLMTTGADKEAYRHIFQTHDPKTPHNVPSAARLAQVLRADQILKDKDGKPTNPQVSGLAQSIRDGNRREVADINPDQVQSILSNAMGGPSKAAQSLNSPSIAGMIDRYQTNVHNLQNNRLEREKTITSSLGVSAKHGPPGKSDNNITSHKNRDNNITSHKNRDIHLSNDLNSTPEPDLMDMLANNEESHLNKVNSLDMTQPTQDSKGKGSSSSQSTIINSSGSIDVSHKPKTSQEHKLTGPTSIPTPKESAVMPMSSIPTPKGGMAQSIASAVSGSGGKKSSNMKLEGKLKIIGQNGQSIADGLIDGNMT